MADGRLWQLAAPAHDQQDCRIAELSLAFGGPDTTFIGKFNLLSATIPSKAVRHFSKD